MTVSDEQTVEIRPCNSVTKEFEFTFTLPQNGDPRRILVFYVDNSDFSSVLLTLGTDYDVIPNTDSGVAIAGGKVITTFTPVIGMSIHMWRDEITSQDISDNDLYTINQREDGDDNLARVTKENRDRLLMMYQRMSGSGGTITPPIDPPFISPPTQSGTYLVSNIEGLAPYWEESPIVVLPPETTDEGKTIEANNDGTAKWVDYVVPRPLVSDDGKIPVANDDTTVSWVELTVTNPDPSEEGYLFEANDDGTASWKAPAVPHPEVLDVGKIPVANDDGTSSWVEPIVPTPDPTEEGYLFEANNDETASWKAPAVPHPEVLDAGKIPVAKDDGTSSWVEPIVPTPDPTEEGYLFEANNDETASWKAPAVPHPEAADIGKVPVANDDGTSSWVTNTGGVTITNPIIDKYALIAGDTILGSGNLGEGLLDGERTSYSDKMAAETFTFVNTPDDFAKIELFPGSGSSATTYLNVDVAALEGGEYLYVIKDSDTQIRITAKNPSPLPPTELHHVNVGGGAPDNVITFVGHQDVDEVKYAEDSLLVQGADYWDNLELEYALYRRTGYFSDNVLLTAGAVTIDLNNAKAFYTNVSEDITSLSIVNFQDGDHFIWLLRNVGGFGFKITWNGDEIFQDRLAFQSIGLAEEVDGLLFTRRGVYWHVEHIYDCASIKMSEVLIVDGDDLGNITTASGSGLVVQGTGTTRFEDDALYNATMVSTKYKQIGYESTSKTISAGVITINILTESTTFIVDVNQNVTEIVENSNFDRARSANFSIFFEETGDGFTYDFGDNFLLESGAYPEDSVTGGFKYYTCVWLPALQLWYAHRQQ